MAPDPTIICRFVLSEEGVQIVVRFRATAFREDKATGNYVELEPLPGLKEVTAKGDFPLDLSDPNSRLSRMIGAIAANRGKISDLEDVGAQLWTCLLSAEVSERFEAIREHWANESPFYQIRLVLPQELDDLPWETLNDERRVGFFSKAEDYCVIRVPGEKIVLPEFGKPHAPPLRIVVAIPEGSNLGVGKELRTIEAEIEQAAGDAITLKPLRGRVTPTSLSDELIAQRTAIVQFSGHGGVAGERVKLRFNAQDPSADPQDLDIGDFAGMFRNRGVRLVLLNSCHSATGYSNQALSGAGPPLMRSGVPAVIAMRHEIEDADAICFSSEFYRRLVQTGRLDLAVAWARHQVSLNSTPDRVQGFATPAFYVAEGIPRLFQPTTVKRPPDDTGTTDEAASGPKVTLPSPLVRAVAQRRCIPILGPGMLRTSVPRSVPVTPPPGPKELAERLKTKYGYPEDNDFKISDHADWTDLFLLQRVCQHSLTTPDGYTVFQEIADAYLKLEPPASLLRMATWPLPGVVCTYIDGLMGEALTRKENPPRVLNRVDTAADVEENKTVLLNLRGSVRDTKTLVLTEEDHEKLWDLMASLTASISNLVCKEDGRTLLFCGVSPRDQTVRRFMQRLLPNGPPRTMGPIYWVVSQAALVDDTYWRRYRVEWIVESSDRFIDALTGTLAGPKR